MTQSLPSLEIVLDLVRAERDLLATHFDALDTKAGVILGFAGVLVALSSDVQGWLGAASVLAALAAAFLAVATFWPRKEPILLAVVLDEYLRAEAVFTKLRVLDSLGQLLQEGREALDRKGLTLKVAMLSLASSAIANGLGQIVS